MFLAICRTLKNFCGQIRNFRSISEERLRSAERFHYYDGGKNGDSFSRENEVREGTSSEEKEERLDKAHG
ncbi:hypothetical protein [Pectobacterium carotovorum]|uniref:hypothetical protein n=1 Tax=Pectobacterium carotovorum TaxID=554 RepID=UPI0038295BCD